VCQSRTGHNGYLASGQGADTGCRSELFQLCSSCSLPTTGIGLERTNVVNRPVTRRISDQNCEWRRRNRSREEVLQQTRNDVSRNRMIIGEQNTKSICFLHGIVSDLRSPRAMIWPIFRAREISSWPAKRGTLPAHSMGAKYMSSDDWLETDNRPQVSPFGLIPFRRYTTNALLGCCLDGRLSMPLPYLCTACGLGRYRCNP
jgi:hypothetical protein